LENKPLNNKQMKKQTAIEWLEERMPTVFKNLTINKHLFEQAKEMEKEQMEDAWYAGDGDEDALYLYSTKLINQNNPKNFK
jgi:hypothetical protein